MPPLGFYKDSVCKKAVPPRGSYKDSVCKRLCPPWVFTYTISWELDASIFLSRLEQRVRKFGSGMVFLEVFASTAHAYDRGVSEPVRGSPRATPGARQE